MITYLTGASMPVAEEYAAKRPNSLGVMLQPDSHYHTKLHIYRWWAADNGCFAARWDQSKWANWLQMIGRDYWTNGCFFATAPDVVGDARATIDKSLPWLDRIRSWGFPVAFVYQDGAERDPLNLIPWDHFDWGFIGGSTEFKLDPERAGLLTQISRERGIPVHMGRVNSFKRLKLANDWGCYSADGTYLKFGPKINMPKLARWLDRLNPIEEEKTA